MSHNNTSTSSADASIIVIDPGSGYIKAGWAGEDSPRVVIPNIAINLTSQSVPSNVTEVYGDLEWVFGNDALAVLQLASDSTSQHNLHTIRPIERGIIKDWDTFILIIEYVIERHLHVRDPAQHPVLLVIHPNTRPSARVDLVRSIFKALGCPSILLQNSSSCGIYSVGRTTALAIDIGESLTTIAPIYEGFVLPQSITCIPIGGADVTKALVQTFSSTNDNSTIHTVFNNPNTSKLAKLHMACTLKESISVIHPTSLPEDLQEIVPYDKSLGGGKQSSVQGNVYSKSLTKLSAELQEDGNLLIENGNLYVLSYNARIRPAEILFKPALVQAYTSHSLNNNPNNTDHNDILVHMNQTASPSSFICTSNTSSSTSSSSGNPNAHTHTSHAKGQKDEKTEPGAIQHIYASTIPTPTSLAHIPPHSNILKIISQETLNKTFPSLAEAVMHCINSCDEVLTHDLLNSIVLFGGSSLLTGLAPRLYSELAQLLMKCNKGDTSMASIQNRVKIHSDSRRHFASFIGASMIGSLPSSVQVLKITNAEFQADPSIVHKKYM